nr:reverse transcriptase domain-containing protein [Tanacetum cinerariifolium]
MRVPFEQRNKPPAEPRVFCAPILDINHFCHFLDTLENYNPMDDDPMWAADRVVALTLADLGASINLIPYSLYAKLSLKTLKPTKMIVRLADRSFQYPVGIAKNMLVKVGKFTFPVDFVILEMDEDSKVPLILGRLFLHTTDAVIRVKKNNSTLDIDVIDEILEEDFDALLD